MGLTRSYECKIRWQTGISIWGASGHARSEKWVFMEGQYLPVGFWNQESESDSFFGINMSAYETNDISMRSGSIDRRESQIWGFGQEKLEYSWNVIPEFIKQNTPWLVSKGLDRFPVRTEHEGKAQIASLRSLKSRGSTFLDWYARYKVPINT